MVAEVGAVLEITADSVVYWILKGKPSLLFTASEAFSNLAFESPPAAALSKTTLVSHRNRKQNSSWVCQESVTEYGLFLRPTHWHWMGGEWLTYISVHQQYTVIYSKHIQKSVKKTALKPYIFRKQGGNTLLIDLICLKILCE